MKQYEYEAFDANHKKVSGKYMANDEKQLATELSKMGLYLVSAKLYTGATPSAFFTTGTGKVKTAELTMFCRQFSIMTSAGVPVIDILDILQGQSYTPYFKKILGIINDDIKAGALFSEAVDKHEKVFPEFFRSMIRIAEHSGMLEKVFQNIADYYERDSKTKAALKSALSYPIMLMGMTVAVVIAMLVYIVPTFRESLSSLDVEPTGITAIVYTMSDWILSNWLYVLAIVVVVVGGLFVFKMTEKGKYCFGWLSVRIPMIKLISIDMMSSRFSRSFSLLLSSGMDTGEALDAVQMVMVNKEVISRFKLAAEEIKHGTSMSESFAKYKLFPNMLIQMIKVGERTGGVAEVLLRSCDFLDDQAARTIAGVTSKIQPIILCILGGVIGALFIAIYSPMISIMTTL